MADMTIYLTPEGREKLDKELRELVARRPSMAQRIEHAKELGDLSENAEYHDAKDEQGMLESRIREIQSVLIQAHVVEKSGNSEKVSLGSKITTSANSTEKIYEIVGMNEANPSTGKISSESPLGQAFLGRREGDEVAVSVPVGRIIYKILKIE